MTSPSRNSFLICMSCRALTQILSLIQWHENKYLCLNMITVSHELVCKQDSRRWCSP